MVEHVCGIHNVTGLIVDYSFYFVVSNDLLLCYKGR